MHVEEAYATWHFTIILISLRVEVAQISDYLLHAKILPLLKAFFSINLPHSTLGKKDSSFTKKKQLQRPSKDLANQERHLQRHGIVVWKSLLN